MKNKIKLALVLIFILLAEWSAIQAQSASSTSNQLTPGGQVVFGLQLPQETVLIQKVAGYRSYRIASEIKVIEQFFRTNFASAKDISITARTVGDVRVVIFEDKGQRVWSTIQLSGVAGWNNSYLIISTDTPSAIDEHR